MQSSVNFLPVLGIMLLLFAGCASPKHTVVLMSDPDGHVGAATVTTAGGKQCLDKAGDLTQVSGSSAPSSPVTADPHYLVVRFADALAVEPVPAEKFILFFETGSTTLVPQSLPLINTIAEVIKRRDALSIAISGHTDAAGSNQLNDRLAHERAVMIQKLLLLRGVSADRLSVSSHGKGNPLVPTPEGVAEPKNRRVEVIVR